MSDHESTSVPLGSLSDDLQYGVRFVIRRRKKLIGYVVTAAGFLVANGYVHGRAELVCNVILGLAGAGLVGGLRNALPRPRPHA